MINLNLLSAPILGKSKFRVLPQNLLTSPGVLKEDFEVIGDWTQSNGSAAANSTQYKTGAKSVKVTTDVGAYGAYWRTVNWDMSSFSRISCWIYIHDALANYNDIMLRFYNNSGQTNGWQARFKYGNFMSGWNLFQIAKSDFTQISAGDWAQPIVRLKIFMQAQAGQIVNASYDSLYIYQSALPAVMLRFDDGYASTYSTAFARMKLYSITGSVACETNLIGSGGHLTSAQLLDLDQHGWAICNHTDSSSELIGQAEAAQEAQIAGGKTALDGWGLTKAYNYLIPPGGTYDANTLTAMTNLGVLLGWGTVPITTRVCYLPPFNPNYIESQTVDNTTALATATGWVDSTITRQSVLAMHFHDIGAGGQMSAADFNSLVDYIYGKRTQLAAITLDDFYRLSLGPAMVRKIL